MTQPAVTFGDALSVLSIDILDTFGNKIGAISSIAPNHARPNTRCRELNSAAKGDVKDLVPGVETITISVTGFALRSTMDSKKTLMNRLPDGTPVSLAQPKLAAAFVSLKDNQTPFDIQEKQTDNRGGMYTKIYKNCLLNSFSYSIGVMGDVVISESASIDVSSIDEV